MEVLGGVVFFLLIDGGVGEFQVYERVEGWAHAKQGHFEGKYVELK